MNFSEAGDDGVSVLRVVDEDLDGAFEDAIVTFDFEFADVDTMKLGDDLGHLVEESKFVEAFDIDGDREEDDMTHLPLSSEDTVATVGLEFLCVGTLEFVDNNVLVVIDVAHDFVARDRFATVTKGVLVLDALFSELDGFLLVEVLIDSRLLLFLLRS